MRKRSLIERIRLVGEGGMNVAAALGRATLFLFHALFGPSGLDNRFSLLVRQLYSVGVLSLAIVGRGSTSSHRDYGPALYPCHCSP